MNFHLEQALATGGRFGRITTQMTNKATISIAITLETPMCTLYTKGGTAPYLSLSMLDKIKHVPNIATMSISAFASNSNGLRGCKNGLSEFTGMKNKLIFSTLHDSGVPMPTGKNERARVAIRTKNGNCLLSPESYMEMQGYMRPDWILALGDADTDQTSSEKRCLKAVDRTLDWLDCIVKEREKNEALKNSSIIGAIVGGFSERQRKRSAQETSAMPVDGFLLEGFYQKNKDNDKEEENVFENESFCQILSKTMSYLPEDKPRIMEGEWSPLQVVQAVRLGVDIFSSAYPHSLTEKGHAMGQHFIPAKTIPHPEKCDDTENNRCAVDVDSSVIDLRDKKYFEDFGPVVSGCQCYTCITFTRSYIHHLLNTSELLASVLLTIHNYECFFQFFTSLREAVRHDKLDEFETKLKKQQLNSKS